jgi:two-component system phosphate regulon sensor histidine kinase PhoR
MKRKRLLWQIYPAMLLVLLVSLVAVAWYGSTATQQFYLDQKYEDLKARLGLVEGEIGLLLRGNRIEVLNAFCRGNGKMARTRITVIARDGRVLADSDEDPEKMENHADRPEVVQVLNGGIGRATRFSHTLGRNLIYVAVPIFGVKEHNDIPAISGILRMSLPLTDIEQAIGLIYHRVILACLLVSLLAAAVTLTISRRITRPLERIRNAAAAFSKGDFSGKIMISDREQLSLEMHDLVLTMNQMAAELDERMGMVSRQHDELEAVFASMVEAVVAVDRDERILSLNPAAQSLLGMAYPNSQGKKLLEAIRNQKLSRFVRTILQGLEEEVVESEIVVSDEEGRERILHGRGTMLRSGGSRNGALIVFDDVTKLRKLENMRRDFVANVSHELKTPVTTVKGFIETVLDGGIDDPKQTKEFLRIALRNIDRINAIIDDLLMLSRLEQEDERGELELQRVALINTLQAAIEICTPRAEEKKITLSLHCPADLMARINAPLVEQAVVNLIINAIKYSDSEKKVAISAFGEENETVVRVQDYGIGIAREHLPRLFERFYRSDKARSRKLGGTGLGLAIVKHIVQAHGGSVAVASTPGKETTFTFRLPR